MGSDLPRQSGLAPVFSTIAFSKNRVTSVYLGFPVSEVSPRFLAFVLSHQRAAQTSGTEDNSGREYSGQVRRQYLGTTQVCRKPCGLTATGATIPSAEAYPLIARRVSYVPSAPRQTDPV